MNTKNEFVAVKVAAIELHLINFAMVQDLDESCFQKIDAETLKSFDDFPKLEENQVYFFTRSHHQVFVDLVTKFSFGGVDEGEESAYVPGNYTSVSAGQLGFIHGRPMLTDTFSGPHRQLGPTLAGFYVVTIPEEALLAAARVVEPVPGGRSLYADARVAEPKKVGEGSFFVRADVEPAGRGLCTPAIPEESLQDAEDWAADDNTYTPQQVAILNFERLVDAEYGQVINELMNNTFANVDGPLRAYISDAMRYRALHQERMRYLGSAGLMNDQIRDNGYAHIGLELWTLTGEVIERMKPILDDQHNRAKEMLNIYTAISAVTNAEKCGFAGAKKADT